MYGADIESNGTTVSWDQTSGTGRAMGYNGDVRVYGTKA